MANQVHRHRQVPEAAILELSADRFGPVTLLATSDQVADGGDRLRSAEQDEIRLTGADGVRELVDEMLGTLPAHRLQDRSRGIGPDPARNRAREVVGPTERRDDFRPGGLELADRSDDGDLGREPGPVERIVERGDRSLAGEVRRRQRLIARRLDLLGELTNADDHRGTVVHRCSQSL